MKKLFYIIEPIDVDGDKNPDGFLASQYRIDKYGNKIFLKNKYITFAAFNTRLNKNGGAKKKTAPKPKRKLIKNKTDTIVMTKDQYNKFMNQNAYGQQYPHNNNNLYPQLPQYPPGVLINTGNNIPFNGFNNSYNPNIPYDPNNNNPNNPNNNNPNNPNNPNNNNPNNPNNPNNNNPNNPTFMQRIGDSMATGAGLGFGFAAGDALFDGVASFF